MAKTNDKKFQLQGKYNRNFSEAFKRSKVSDLEKGLLTLKDLCSQYELSRSSVYKWLYLYGKAEKGIKTVVQMESEQVKTQLLQQRLAELERIIGQKQLQIDVLEKSFEIASEDVGYDIKKKYGPPHWNGSELINKPTTMT
jgi:transposase